MTENELHLCCAILLADLGGGDRPTSDQRRRAALAVMCEWLSLTGDCLFPFTIDDIERWSITLRKSRDAQVKVDVALAYGARCFWYGRGRGPCSSEVEVGHLWQRCNGGPLTKENCHIECRAHNNQRREMSIEEYIKSGMTTEATDGTNSQP